MEARFCHWININIYIYNSDFITCNCEFVSCNFGKKMVGLYLTVLTFFLTIVSLQFTGSLFGLAVESFAECFTEAQKSSQVMRHFLPKRTSSSAASIRPRPALTQQTAKSTPATPEPWPPEGRLDRGCSCSARRYPFPKRQGPRPKIALDPAPQKSYWSARQKEEGPESRYRRTTLQAASNVPLATPLGAEDSVFLVLHGPNIASRSPTAVTADKIKHIDFQKERKNIFLPTISVIPLCSQSLQPFLPLATWAEAWQAIPGVSAWVMTTVRRYNLQFARRPPRFTGVLATTVRSEDAQVLHAEVMNLL